MSCISCTIWVLSPSANSAGMLYYLRSSQIMSSLVLTIFMETYFVLDSSSYHVNIKGLVNYLQGSMLITTTLPPRIAISATYRSSGLDTGNIGMRFVVINSVIFCLYFYWSSIKCWYRHSGFLWHIAVMLFSLMKHRNSRDLSTGVNSLMEIDSLLLTVSPSAHQKG